MIDRIRLNEQKKKVYKEKEVIEGQKCNLKF